MNKQQYFIIPEGKVVVEARELFGKLNKLATDVNDKLPLNLAVEIRRTNEVQFTFSIVDVVTKIPVQEFGIEWDPTTKFVTWAAVL